MLELERLPLLAASSGGMTEVSYRPEADGEGMEKLIAWATAARPKPNVCPHCRAEHQHPAVTMPMSARRRNQRRQTLDQFERCEHQADAAAGTRRDALVDRVFGIDFTPALQREGRASAMPQQAS